MTDEDFGPWIEHDGAERHFPDGTFVHAIDNEGDDYFSPADEIDWDWMTCHRLGCILRYRIRKPRALRALIELVENLPESVDA